MTNANTRVFLTMPDRGIVASTDRAYLYDHLIKLAERFPLEFIRNDHLDSRLYDDVRHVIHRALGAITSASTPRDDIWTWVRIPEDIDVAYCYGQFPRRVPKYTPIVWQQTFAPMEAQGSFQTWRDQLVRSRRRAMLRADCIAVPSETSLTYASDLFPEERHKLELLPYYLPGLEPISESLLADKADITPIRLLFIGKQARRKGLVTLVRAWARLSAEVRARFEVIVVTPFLDGLVSMPPEFRHTVFVEKLYSMLRQAHLLVFPTLREAYGLVLVEAMACGLAIVTTTAPIQRDIVGEGGGMFIDPKDDAALADALTELAQTPERIQVMAHTNLQRFRSRYWHEVVGQRHVDIFRRIADERT